MNKIFYIFTSILLITSCNNQDVENIINDNSVDWTNENTCSVSIDNEFIDNNDLKKATYLISKTQN